MWAATLPYTHPSSQWLQEPRTQSPSLHALSSNIFRELSTLDSSSPCQHVPCPPPYRHLPPLTPPPFLSLQYATFSLFTPSGSWLNQPERNGSHANTEISTLPRSQACGFSPRLPKFLSPRELGEGMWLDGSRESTNVCCAPAELALGCKGLVQACTCKKSLRQ